MFHIGSGHKVVHIRHRRLKAPRQRLEITSAQQRIQPHDATHSTLDPSQRLRQIVRITGLPAVAKQENRRVAIQQIVIIGVEIGQRLAYPRPSRPMIDCPAYSRQRLLE